MILTGFLSSGCSPRFLISEEDILPGFASEIKVIALLRPIVKSSSTVSIRADLFEHFKYGPNLPILIVMSSFKSGCLPKTFGKEHKYLAFSKSTFSIGRPLGIETFFKFSFSFFFLLRFFLFSTDVSTSISNCK
tara:strand:+ start:132 stop:533 length:402 start_codon:yes stop_codon:yes gene_type:complete